MRISEEVREALRKSFVIALAVAPFGMLFGALARQHGMSLFELTLMSASIYAGASQLVGLELFGNAIPLYVIVLSIVAVNFRHVLYSAAVTPYVRHFTLAQKAAAFFVLVDPQFAETVARGETHRQVTFRWYMAHALTLYCVWVASTIAGGLIGRYLGDPVRLGLDILLPVYFLGMVMGFRKRENFLPVVIVSAIGSVVAHRYVGSPWHVSLGAAVGIAVAAIMPPVRSNRKPEPLAETGKH